MKWTTCQIPAQSLIGLDGKVMGEYAVAWGNSGRTMQLNRVTESAYFAGKKVLPTVARDRLGSVRGASSAVNKPYGENYTAGNTDGFATYYQDSATALSYADQRYYSAQYGRFLSPDRYISSGGPSDPGSWNRYSYVGNDPANYGDPSGEQKAGPDDFSLPGQLIKWQMVVEPSDDPEGGFTVIFVPTSFMPYAVTNTLQKRILSAAQTTMRMDSKLEATINDLSSDCLNSLGALGQEFGQVVGRTNLAAYVLNLNFYSGTGGEGLLTLEPKPGCRAMSKVVVRRSCPLLLQWLPTPTRLAIRKAVTTR